MRNVNSDLMSQSLNAAWKKSGMNPHAFLNYLKNTRPIFDISGLSFHVVTHGYIIVIDLYKILNPLGKAQYSYSVLRSARFLRFIVQRSVVSFNLYFHTICLRHVMLCRAVAM